MDRLVQGVSRGVSSIQATVFILNIFKTFKNINHLIPLSL
jgi:hypothetical protein